MTVRARDAALSQLERYLYDMEDADPEQQPWKLAFAEGMVLAYERIEIFTHEEATRWRKRLIGALRHDAGPLHLVKADHEAGIAYLEKVLANVTAVRADSTLDEIGRSAEAAAAIDTLHAVGALDDAAHREWLARLLAKQTPWLDAASQPGWLAVATPAGMGGNVSQDAVAGAGTSPTPRALKVLRVVLGSADRHAGLAIVALAVHEDATSVLFHMARDVTSDQGREPATTFPGTGEGFDAPALRDDQDRVYRPVDRRPVATYGPSTAHRERRIVVMGTWMYSPAAPDDAKSFSIQRPGGTWALRSG